jgi:hypothetical protein
MMRLRLRPALVLVAIVTVIGCRMAGSDARFGAIERLNTAPSTLGLFTFPYYVALAGLDGGGAVVAWMRQEGDFRPLVYRHAADGRASFGDEQYLSPEGVRDTISLIPGLEHGPTGGELYAVWQARQPRTGNKFIMFRSSHDGGAHWDPGVRVNSETTSFIPAVASDATGGIYAAWVDERKQGFRLFFNRSRDGGKTWLPEDVRIEAVDKKYTTVISVSIATDGAGTVLVVWEQESGRGRRVQAARSPDRGETWGASVLVDDGTSELSPSAPQVVFAGEHPVVVWTAAMTGDHSVGQVWSDSSNDGGATWGADVLVHEVQGGLAPRVDLSAHDGKARALFHAGPIRTEWQIYYTETGPDGQWRARGDEVAKVGPPARKLANPRLAIASDGTLYAVYGADNRGVLLSWSTDGGTTWKIGSEPVYALDKDVGGTVRYPQIAVAGDVAYVVWEVWGDRAATYKTLADADRKSQPADLYVRRVSVRR